MGVAAQKDFFAVVGSAGKGRVDVHQIHLAPHGQQVGAGGLAFAVHDHIGRHLRRLLGGPWRVAGAYLLDRAHFVQRQPPAKALAGPEIAAVAQRPGEVAQHGLAAQHDRVYGDVAYGHERDEGVGGFYAASGNGSGA